MPKKSEFQYFLQIVNIPKTKLKCTETKLKTLPVYRYSKTKLKSLPVCSYSNDIQIKKIAIT